VDPRYADIRINAENLDKPELPIRVEVECEHGKSRVYHTRTCRNGCHLDPLRALSCGNTNPSEEDVYQSAVAKHGARYRCLCVQLYWMRLGPLHEVDRSVHGLGTVREGPVDGEDGETLKAAEAYRARMRRAMGH
jgi:hypothetical protein